MFSHRGNCQEGDGS